mmetsp:Transcript_9419/g.23000  ORF Transcript_9419/g.23000 Transcript_9419/m.23000 type:complete len:240 (-) Transcript_9419:245-964(-)
MCVLDNFFAGVHMQAAASGNNGHSSSFLAPTLVKHDIQNAPSRVRPPPTTACTLTAPVPTAPRRDPRTASQIPRDCPSIVRTRCHPPRSFSPRLDGIRPIRDQFVPIIDNTNPVVRSSHHSQFPSENQTDIIVAIVGGGKVRPRTKIFTNLPTAILLPVVRAHRRCHRLCLPLVEARSVRPDQQGTAWRRCREVSSRRRSSIRSSISARIPSSSSRSDYYFHFRRPLLLLLLLLLLPKN